MSATHMATVFMVPPSDLLSNMVRNGAATRLILHVIELRPGMVSDQDASGMLPLHIALSAKSINDTVVLKLLEVYPFATRVRFGREPFMDYALEVAVRRGCSDNVLIAILKECVHDKDWSNLGFYCPWKESEKDKRGMPLIFEAIKAGISKHVIQTMVDLQCPLNTRDPESNLSVLEMSISLNSEFPVFSYLFDAVVSKMGVDCLFDGSGGGTILHIACLTQSPAYIISRIVDTAVDLSGVSWDSDQGILRERDDQGRTALHCGCATGIPVDSVREMLIRDVGLVSMKDPKGLLPIQIAIQNQPVDGLIFELARPDISLLMIKNRQGDSLLDLAAKYNAPKYAIYELLEVNPDLIYEVEIFNSSSGFASNPAGVEIQRLALTKPQKLRPFNATKAVDLDQLNLPKQGAEKPEPTLKEEVKVAGFFDWFWN